MRFNTVGAPGRSEDTCLRKTTAIVRIEVGSSLLSLSDQECKQLDNLIRNGGQIVPPPQDAQILDVIVNQDASLWVSGLCCGFERHSNFRTPSGDSIAACRAQRALTAYQLHTIFARLLLPTRCFIQPGKRKELLQ